MAHGIVGREAELATAAAFLDDLLQGAGGLVIAGDAGIGKTTLWAAAAALAGARGFTVLQARPVEAEARLSLTTLTDLLEGAVDEVAPGLPGPQRRALEVGLLQADARGAVDQRTLAVAVLGVLRLLAERGPVTVAVDDVQWVDPASAQALNFAVRRLRHEPVGVIAANRRGLAPTFDPAGAMNADRVRTIELGPLTLAATGRVLERVTPGIPRHVLRKVHQASGGNPLHALELARALDGGRLGVEPGQPLPVTAALRDLVAARLAHLGLAARDAILVAACLAQPTQSAVIAALGDPATGGLAQAEAAGVLRVEGERLRFAHPLLASTAYVDAGPERARTLHRRLADVVTDTEERARHLALAADGADAGVAGALDAAALIASSRGAPAAAAELCEQAAGLTPAACAGDARRRRIAAAGHHFAAGDGARARSILGAVVASTPPGPERAAALGLLAEVHSRDNDLFVATDLLRQALDEASDDPTVRAQLELHLQLWLGHMGDAAGARASAHRALAHARIAGEPGLLAIALGAATWVDYLDRRGVNDAWLGEALDLEAYTLGFSAIYWPSYTAGAIWMLVGDVDRACDAFARVYRSILDRGDESSIPLFGTVPVLAACRRGDLAAAARYAEAVTAAATDVGGSLPRLLALGAWATVNAYRGDGAAARASATEAAALAEQLGAGVLGILPMAMAGFVALSEGDPSGCDRALGAIIDGGRVIPGIPQLLCVLAAPDHVEALVGLGRLDEAAGLLAWSEDHAALGGAWAAAAGARSRALLAAGHGDLDSAMASAEDSVTRLGALHMPVERGRSLLVAGRLHRRRKEKAAARGAFEEAISAFDAAGAGLWSRQARHELARVAGHAASATELTPTEARVAELVAAGLTNREVGERAYLTPKSVESVVGRIYRKLGIHSRAELGAAMTVRGEGRRGA